MEIISNLEQLHKYRSDKACVIALGTFDGLHKGHQQVIAEAARLAAEKAARLAVFTFSNHPMEYINPARVPVALLTHEQKLELLKGLGVELLIELPFDEQLARLTPEQFVYSLIKLACQGIAIGENFTYGYKGKGNADSLKAEAEVNGFELVVCHLLMQEDETISSTYIRRLIQAGEVAKAEALLGRCYSISGIVAHGNERGRLLNFPTANLEMSQIKEKLAIPKEGAYAVRVLLADGSAHKGMANIGKNPTFGDVEQTRLEVHLLDFAGNLYDSLIKVEFISRLRDQVKFNNIEQLKQQLEQDKENCRALLAE